MTSAVAAVAMVAPTTPIRSPRKAVADRRQRARRDDAGIEDREGPLGALDRGQLGHRAIQHRRGAVEHRPEQRQQDHGGRQRQVDHGQDQQRRAAFGGQHRADHAHARAEPTAHELAGGAADEHQRERGAHHRRRDALGLHQERQEGQQPHAHRRVEHADREQQRKARAGALRVTARRLVGGSRVTRHVRQPQRDHQRHHHAERRHRPQGMAPRHEGDQQRDGRRQRGFPQVAREVVDAERPARLAPIHARDGTRGQRMLRARAAAGDGQRHAQAQQAARHAGKGITERGQQGAEHQRGARAEHGGDAPRRQLQGRHGAGIDAAQDRQRAVVEAKIRLPDRQQGVDHVGVAVVQRMRRTGEPKYPLARDGAGLLGAAGYGARWGGKGRKSHG